VEHAPRLAIVDSIQTVTSSELPDAGSASQIRAATVKLLEVAKKNNIPIIIIGHITKDGAIAGPKTLEHLVDVVLYLEGDANNFYRLLRGTKNRFGSTDEIGVFEMTAGGMKEVPNPSRALLEDLSGSPGTAIAATVEGNRPILLEIQALTNPTTFGYPNRRTVGFDQNRFSLLLAVLSRRAKLNLGSADVYLNIVGGIKIDDPGADLAVAAAVISSLLDKPLPEKTVLIGEVGLSGEIRRAKAFEKRLDEAAKMGLSKAIVPKLKSPIKSGLQIIEIQNIGELVILIKS
jgi:DNA repair protein RadA/Sms